MPFDKHTNVYYGIYWYEKPMCQGTYAIVPLQWFDEFDYEQNNFIEHRRFQLFEDAKAFYVSKSLGVEPVYSGETWIRGEENN